MTVTFYLTSMIGHLYMFLRRRDFNNSDDDEEETEEEAEAAEAGGRDNRAMEMEQGGAKA